MPSAKPALADRTWWIEPGRLMGGAYPGDLDADVAREKLGAILDCGVTAFLSLMETREVSHDGNAFAPYAPIAESLAAERGIALEFGRLEIVDTKVPSVERMREILAWLDERLARKVICYVHCWGGKGRTGTVAGIYLIRRGLAESENFVERIDALRGKDVRHGPAPENERQREFVRRFPISESRASAPA